MPMITITIKSSISVKPSLRLSICPLRSEVRQVSHVGRVVVRVRRVRVVQLLLRDQAAQVRLHRLEVRLLTRLAELRNRDSSQDADDHDHDQKLDQCETFSALEHMPLTI